MLLQSKQTEQHLQGARARTHIHALTESQLLSLTLVSYIDVQSQTLAYYSTNTIIVYVLHMLENQLGMWKFSSLYLEKCKETALNIKIPTRKPLVSRNCTANILALRKMNSVNGKH